MRRCVPQGGRKQANRAKPDQYKESHDSECIGDIMYRVNRIGFQPFGIGEAVDQYQISSSFRIFMLKVKIGPTFHTQSLHCYVESRMLRNALHADISSLS